MCSVWGFDCAVRGWGDVAAIATMLGGVSIILALVQLRHQSAIARSTFENLFVQAYQELVQKMPTKIFLGETLSVSERQASIGAMFHYLDLCNTQAYHRRQGRVSEATWQEWRDGIISNLARPELQNFWAYVATKSPGEFQDLRNVVQPAPYDPAAPYLPVT